MSCICNADYYVILYLYLFYAMIHNDTLYTRRFALGNPTLEVFCFTVLGVTELRRWGKQNIPLTKAPLTLNSPPPDY